MLFLWTKLDLKLANTGIDILLNTCRPIYWPLRRLTNLSKCYSNVQCTANTDPKTGPVQTRQYVS